MKPIVSMIEEIEKELKEISEAPWFAAGDCADDCPPHKNSGLALVDTGRSSDWPIARLCHWDVAVFIAKAPERIAALVEYVRANEKLIKECPLDLPAMSDELQAARAKLGLK